MRALAVGVLALLALSAAGCDPRVESVVDAASAGAAPPAAGVDGGGGGGAPAVRDAPGGQGAPAPLPPPGSSPPAPPMPETCAEEVHRAERVQVDLLLLVDTSASMDEPSGVQTKWRRAQDALVGFVRDRASAGLGMGLQFFPQVNPFRRCRVENDCDPSAVPAGTRDTCLILNVCIGPGAPPVPQQRGCVNVGDFSTCGRGQSCVPAGQCTLSQGDCINIGLPCQTGGVAGDRCVAAPGFCSSSDQMRCATADYEKLAVPIAALPAGAAPLASALGARATAGGTPMQPAVVGALAALRRQLAANPRHRAGLVLATDGLPSGCASETAAIVRILGDAWNADPPIATFVIGVFGATDVAEARPTLDMLARAGGTGAPFVLTPADDLTARFQEALNLIRGRALPCDFPIAAPRGGAIDYGKVNVRFQGVGGPRDILYVGGADRCHPARGGWYYDVDPATGRAPQRIVTCEATCRLFKAEPDGRVDLAFGCKTRVIE